MLKKITLCSLLLTIAMVSEAKTGKEVYEQTCFACHGTGILNAPKYGDKDAWTALLKEESLEHLYEEAIKGEGAMPPKGGNPNLTDAEVKAAIDYMIEGSK